MDIIKGRILKGRGLATKLGFPTINIEYNGDLSGVFAGIFVLSGKKFNAAVHLGQRPTIGDLNRICEVFVLGKFDEDLSDDFELFLLKKVREVKKFANLDALKTQVFKDIDTIKEIHEKAN